MFLLQALEQNSFPSNSRGGLSSWPPILCSKPAVSLFLYKDPCAYTGPIRIIQDIFSTPQDTYFIISPKVPLLTCLAKILGIGKHLWVVITHPITPVTVSLGAIQLKTTHSMCTDCSILNQKSV